MDVKTGLFYLFAAVLLFAAFRVITARNPVYAALYLVLAFFQAAAIWLLLRAEFLAISLVLVYVGAVMVLFLFVVMMLDINVDSLRQGFWKHFPLAAGVGALIALEMAAVLMGGFRLAKRRAPWRRTGPTVLEHARSWASCCTPSTSIRWKSPRSSCSWPSSPPSR
jgi:NADH-quinone oxidoreductase subunit J